MAAVRLALRLILEVPDKAHSTRPKEWRGKTFNLFENHPGDQLRTRLLAKEISRLWGRLMLNVRKLTNQVCARQIHRLHRLSLR